MIKVVCRGSYIKARSYFEQLLEKSNMGFLDKYGQMGVAALSEMTPERTGKTKDSWSYEIIRESSRNTTTSVSIIWSNSNVNKGVNIAVILQYGHGTGTGGYVVGRDYINPAMQPIFDQIAEDAWREVTSL